MEEEEEKERKKKIGEEAIGGEGGVREGILGGEGKNKWVETRDGRGRKEEENEEIEDWRYRGKRDGIGGRKRGERGGGRVSDGIGRGELGY